MTQVVLIFWKDARCLWRHVGVYVLLLAAYTWAVPQTWPGNTPNSFLGLFVTVLKILIMASNFVLITSALHQDRLVGETQFWLTRPYDWRSLLGAKLLFVLVCVGLPYVLMNWALVLAAGMNPLAPKVDVAARCLSYVLVPLLPLTVIAAVTDNLARAFTLMAVVLVTWAGLLQFAFSGQDARMSPPFESPVLGTLFGTLLLAILCYQFATRRTTHSRIAIAATLALFLLAIFGFDRQGFGAPVRALIRHHYDVPASGSPRLTFSPGPVPYDERSEDLELRRGLLEVKLPIRLEGLPSDAKIRHPNVAVTLVANGAHVALPWVNASVTENVVGFTLPKAVFDRFSGSGTSLHLEFIADEIRPTTTQQVIAANRFPGPLHGNCILSTGKVTCRSAYGAARQIHVEVLTHPAACDGKSPAISAGSWHLDIPAGGLDPVANETLVLQRPVCAGEPLTFTEYGSSQPFRLILDIPEIRLRDYRTPG